MRYLIVASQLGFEPSKAIFPGGLQQFGRCVARALASSSSVKKLAVWSQVEQPGTKCAIQDMIRVYAHATLELEVRVFGGSRTKLAAAVSWACWQGSYDRVMYLLVNQAGLALLPWHLPYTVWEIGRELLQPVSWWKYRTLRQANSLLSISHHTAWAAVQNNPGLPQGKVVHLCVEPPLFAPEFQHDPVTDDPYQPANRELAVLIVGSMYRGLLYKGQRQLIAAWQEVVQACPEAELWIVGSGDGQPELETQAQALPPLIAKQISFLGQIDGTALQDRYQRCRVFAMPSTGEGFGLVFVEAAQYGIPSIGGKYDSVKEIVLHNQTGLLVEQQSHDIARACIELLTNDRLAKRLGAAARQRYLEYFRFEHFRERLLLTLGLEM